MILAVHIKGKRICETQKVDYLFFLLFFFIFAVSSSVLPFIFVFCLSPVFSICLPLFIESDSSFSFFIFLLSSFLLQVSSLRSYFLLHILILSLLRFATFYSLLDVSLSFSSILFLLCLFFSFFFILPSCVT